MQRRLHVILGALAGYVLYSSFNDLGVAAVFVNLFTPLPAAYLGMRYGVRTGGTVVALTALSILLLGGMSPMALYLLQFGLPAVLLPWLMQRGTGWDRAVATVVGLMVAASVSGLVATSIAAGESPLTVAGRLIDEEVSRTKTMMNEMFAGADLPAEQLAEVTRSVEQMAEFIHKVYPSVIVTVAGIMVLGLVLLLSLAARGRYVIPGKAFPQWKAPDFLVWFLIAAGFTVVFAEGVPATFAMNLLVILLPVYFLQGLAVLDCFFRRKAFSPLLRGIGYVLVTVINPLPMVVTGIGVFDLWADFRKPRQTES